MSKDLIQYNISVITTWMEAGREIRRDPDSNELIIKDNMLDTFNRLNISNACQLEELKNNELYMSSALIMTIKYVSDRAL